MEACLRVGNLTGDKSVEKKPQNPNLLQYRVISDGTGVEIGHQYLVQM